MLQNSVSEGAIYKSEVHSLFYRQGREVPDQRKTFNHSF